MQQRMSRLTLSSGLFLLFTAGAQAQQYPMLDRVADKVIQKYQTSSCQELATQRSRPRSGQQAAAEQRVVQLLRQDAAMREEFINRVAAPIANKLFACGLIP